MISVIGLGQVGTIMAASLAFSGRRVVAFDHDPTKVDALGSGRSPFVEAGLDYRISSSVASGRLRATRDVIDAITTTRVSMVCVGTPSAHDGSVDLSQLTAACESIGPALALVDHYHLVVIRSTVLPGTTRRTVIPLLERVSGRRAGDAFGVCYSPEFLREGDAIRDFENPQKIVVGENASADGDITLSLLPQQQGTAIIRTDFESAEMLKYIDNSWHALKIAFANEIGAMAKVLGLDGRRLMSDFARDNRQNISAAYLTPGAPYGGNCLPKDVAALCSLAHAKDLDVPLLASIARSNTAHKGRLLRLVASHPAKRIGIIGVAFKAGIDDIRGSPYLDLAVTLTRLGREVHIFDPHLSGARMAACASIDTEAAPSVASSIEELVKCADVLVLCHLNLIEVGELSQLMRPNQLLIDLVGVGREIAGPASYSGICW